MQTEQHTQTHKVPAGVRVIITDDRIFGEDHRINQLIQGTPGSAGYDLTAWPEKPVRLVSGEKSVLIPLGFKMHIQATALAAMIYPRSGLGHKQGLVLGNTVGVIDSDYQGDMFASVYNRGQADIVINPGDRIAQLVFTQVYHPGLQLVSEFEEATARGAGGFGSTGVATRPVSIN